MRCKSCGSENVGIETPTTTTYSYSKGLIGTLLLGPVGAVAGINGKKKTTLYYCCKDCGLRGNYHDVIEGK